MKTYTKTLLRFEQVRGVKIIAETWGGFRAKRSPRLDRIWAVRDREQTQRQVKRDRWRDKYRPILTHRTLVKMRNAKEWNWT